MHPRSTSSPDRTRTRAHRVRTRTRAAVAALLVAGTALAAGLLARAAPSSAPAAAPAATAAVRAPASAPASATSAPSTPRAPSATSPAPLSAPRAPAPSLDGIALAAPDAAAVHVPSSPDAWGGPRTGAEPTLSDRVADYDIAATLDPVKHTVTGRERLTWRNRSNVAVKSVYLHLYMNAFESAGSTFFTERRERDGAFRSGVGIQDAWGHIDLSRVAQGGAAVPWTFVHPDNGPATDHTVVRLDLPRAVAPGASTTLDIDFLTQLPRVVARTGYWGSFHLVAQWFPKIGVLELPGERGATAPRWNVHEFHLNSEFYADFGLYDVKLTVPRDYTVGATGEPQGAPVEQGGMRTWHFVQGDVHDFAWSADNRMAKPLVGTWTGPGSPSVTVTVLYPPEFAASAAPALAATKASLTYFSNTLGPYPYRTVTVVIPPYNAEEAGGMEYPTFFTAEAYATVEPQTSNQYALAFVTIHEFGHGYFYGLLASNEFEEPILDEGLNEYWDHRMMRDTGQLAYEFGPLLRRLGFAPGSPTFDAERGATPRADPADPPGANAWHRLQDIGPVYTRTATVMRDLEARIGKAPMERAFKEYYRRWKFRHPSTADLRETLAEVTGQRAVVEDVFARQIYATSRIDDRVADLTSTEQVPLPGSRMAGATRVVDRDADIDKRIDAARAQWKKTHPQAPDRTGPYPYRTEVTVRRHGAPVAQSLVVNFADGSSETAQWDADERWHKFVWTKPARAVSAQLDPQRRHYLDVNKLDDSRTLVANPAATRRWGLDFAALADYLFSFIATL